MIRTGTVNSERVVNPSTCAAKRSVDPGGASSGFTMPRANCCLGRGDHLLNLSIDSGDSRETGQPLVAA